MTVEEIALVLVVIRSNERGRDHSDNAMLSAAAMTARGVMLPWTSRQRERASASEMTGSALGTQHTTSMTEFSTHHMKMRRAKDCSAAILLPRRIASRATSESVKITILTGTGRGMLRRR